MGRKLRVLTYLLNIRYKFLLHGSQHQLLLFILVSSSSSSYSSLQTFIIIDLQPSTHSLYVITYYVPGIEPGTGDAVKNGVWPLLWRSKTVKVTKYLQYGVLGPLTKTRVKDERCVCRSVSCEGDTSPVHAESKPLTNGSRTPPWSNRHTPLFSKPCCTLCYCHLVCGILIFIFRLFIYCSLHVLSTPSAEGSVADMVVFAHEFHR